MATKEQMKIWMENSASPYSRCGAKTRAGTPCKRRDLYNSGRCKLHGGLSTGPRTKEGKNRSALNGNISKKKRTPREHDKT